MRVRGGELPMVRQTRSIGKSRPPHAEAAGGAGHAARKFFFATAKTLADNGGGVVCRQRDDGVDDFQCRYRPARLEPQFRRLPRGGML